MIHKIETTCESELTIQKVQVTVYGKNGDEPAPDEICIMIYDSELKEERTAFLTKLNAIMLAQKLYALATDSN